MQQAANTPGMRRAVLDTNVWLDWLVFDDAGVRALRAAHGQGALALVAAPATRAELACVLARPAFGLDAAQVAARLAEHDRSVHLHASPVPPCAMRCTDPDDQMFLDLAVALRAGLLVTHDRALLRLARRAQRQANLRIVRPRDL